MGSTFSPFPSGSRPASLRVLLVDDCAPTRTLVREVLTVVGCQVVEADNAESALDFLSRNPVDVLLTDIMLPGRSGVWLVGEAAARGLARRIVAASGGGEIGGVDGLDAARAAGACRVLPKPVPMRALLDAVLENSAVVAAVRA